MSGYRHFADVYVFLPQAACATSGDGLYEGLDWLSANIKQRVG
jgi:hypothetical protein